MCIIVLPCCPQRSEVCARFPGTGILYRDNCEPLCGYWELNLDPLLRARKKNLLNTESYLQFWSSLFYLKLIRRAIKIRL